MSDFITTIRSAFSVSQNLQREYIFSPFEIRKIYNSYNEETNTLNFERRTIMNALKKELTKMAIGTPIGFCAGKVAMDVVEQVLPAHVRLPMKVVRYVGTAAIGLVAESIVARSVDDLVDSAETVSETLKAAKQITAQQEVIEIPKRGAR